MILGWGTMKTLLLIKIIPVEIVDFLNTCSLEFEIISSFYLDDYSTNIRVLNHTDKILFRNIDSETETFLKLKYGDLIMDCPVYSYK